MSDEEKDKAGKDKSKGVGMDKPGMGVPGMGAPDKSGKAGKRAPKPSPEEDI